MPDRLETGVFQPDGDWPGIFIRGDNALAYARQLNALYTLAEERAKAANMHSDEAMLWTSAKALSDLLGSCDARLVQSPNG